MQEDWDTSLSYVLERALSSLGSYPLASASAELNPALSFYPYKKLSNVPSRSDTPGLSGVTSHMPPPSPPSPKDDGEGASDDFEEFKDNPTICRAMDAELEEMALDLPPGSWNC